MPTLALEDYPRTGQNFHPPAGPDVCLRTGQDLFAGTRPAPAATRAPAPFNPCDAKLAATLVSAPGSARHYTHAGTTIHVKATARETSHAQSLIELTVPAGFPGAPLHFHKTFVESFYVLEGQLSLIRGDETLTVKAGALLHMPIGVVHGYRNASDQPARFLIICTPGGFDAFYTDLITWMQREPQWPPADRNALIAFGLKHDTFYL